MIKDGWKMDGKLGRWGGVCRQGQERITSQHRKWYRCNRVQLDSLMDEKLLVLGLL